jgi:hypothetical protein
MMRIILAGLAIAVIAIGLYVALSGYGELSPRGAELALALRGATGRQDLEAVTATEQAIALDVKDGVIGSNEAGWLQAIVLDAKNGAWADAVDAATELLSDQVTENPLPEL